ncbi:heavy metal translocatin [Viridothelium virens]|uniref:Heavy metal translocatin n=1 Tax=Viridothelium virens TaxID=1048519 RepID=A0A6A6HI19_VIRVR|nr:heavy metal translocatin [Viridothelium virens]
MLAEKLSSRDALSTGVFKAEVSIIGMTCSACTGAITDAVQALEFVHSITVSLITNSATVEFEDRSNAKRIVETIEDTGFDAILENVLDVNSEAKANRESRIVQIDLWRATYAIGGMTCSACSSAISGALGNLSFVRNIDINLIHNSGTVVFTGRHHLDEITEAIEDCGFDATLDAVASFDQKKEEDIGRVLQIKIAGMHCPSCPGRVLEALDAFKDDTLQLEESLILENPVLKIKYTPHPPNFTIRHIIAAIASVDSNFEVSIYHPPTIEERSKATLAKHRRGILLRLLLSFIMAIPTFVIGVVIMSLLSAESPTRMFMMEPWAANVSRTEWALFILSTPVYFFAADTYHKKALKEVRALWRPSSRTPVLRRFYRFGSMNTLICLGTSVAYFSSIANLAITANSGATSSGDSFYFDSVVFLTMFLLIGRFLEAYSKAKTGDAVESLGKLRPSEAILIDPIAMQDQIVLVDLLEVGDVVRVSNGSSPPFDGIVLQGEASFDEASLTGESRPVTKTVGDTVYSGTVNKTGPITVGISSIAGTSMLDQIIQVVREGQTRRAPVERAADLITGHFAPFVVLVGIITWIVWMSLGLSHALPSDYRDSDAGGWSFWALRFAIAVFVIACPCGIGLAAPTALFVGGGLAAKNGILVKGGGEAFQEASTLDCIVFDKTGTLTQGEDPAVTDYESYNGDDDQVYLAMAKCLEENSLHPVASAITTFCSNQHNVSQALNTVEMTDIDEIVGKGMRGTFKARTISSELVSVILGNERLMSDHGVELSLAQLKTIDLWKSQGKSIGLMAVNTRLHTSEKSPLRQPTAGTYKLSTIFAITDPLRPEASIVISALQSCNIAVWMLSGDNPTTAQAVGAQVGISSDNIIAGVLPDQKAEKIRWLQDYLSKPIRPNILKRFFRAICGRSLQSFARLERKKATVAMVGDGINDAPALATADIGIAIGSGSDVALSSASFVLINSHLSTLLTLINLSRLVFRRVWFNFGWALVYNCVAMPIAAGVLYPLKSAGVCSSLALRSGLPGLGFRRGANLAGKISGRSSSAKLHNQNRDGCATGRRSEARLEEGVEIEGKDLRQEVSRK